MVAGVLGKVFIYPTDTVWGIGGSVFDQMAYENMCAIKGRDDRPVSLLFSHIGQLRRYFDLPLAFDDELLRELYKKELTFCWSKDYLKGRPLPDYIARNSDIVGTRVLEDQEIKKLSEMAQDAPIITTSLNRSGERPITKYAKAQAFAREKAPEAIFPHHWDEKKVQKWDALASETASSVIRLDEKGEVVFFEKGA